jgi:lysozyme
MTVDQAGIDFTKGFEGFSAAPYKDVAGVWTVGYGHKIKEGEDFSMGISMSQGETLLYDDMEHPEAAILKLAPDCNQNQFNALADFGFNLGVGALEQMLSHGILQVPTQMLRWNKAHVNGELIEVKGLTRRRQAEVALFEKEAV